MKASELIEKLYIKMKEYGDREVMLENRSDCGLDSHTKDVFISGGFNSVGGVESDEICFFIEADFNK